MTFFVGPPFNCPKFFVSFFFIVLKFRMKNSGAFNTLVLSWSGLISLVVFQLQKLCAQNVFKRKAPLRIVSLLAFRFDSSSFHLDFQFFIRNETLFIVSQTLGLTPTCALMILLLLREIKNHSIVLFARQQNFKSLLDCSPLSIMAFRCKAQK